MITRPEIASGAEQEEPARRSRTRRVWIAVYLVALALRVVLAVPFSHDWDGYVFRRTAENMLHGETPYRTAERNAPDIYPSSETSMTQQWYAYPPLPMLMFTTSYGIVRAAGFEPTSLVANVALKAPFIAGDLVCAFLVWLLLKRRGRRIAAGATVLILFNPLLMWVSSAWGMFDLWMVNFLLLFLLALRWRRFVLAGVFIALAPEVKLFPLLFLPVAAVYLWNRAPGRDTVRKAGGAFAATTAVCVLPFLLTAPRGFVNQNFLMHLERPPQGVGLTGMLAYLSRVFETDISASLVLLVPTAVLIAVFTVWGIRTVGTNEVRLLDVVTLIYATAMLGNKVVNEQYFVVLVALFVVLAAFARTGEAARPTLSSSRFYVWAEGVTSAGVLATTMLLGYHFLTFFLAPFAQSAFGASTDDLVYELSSLAPRFPRHTFPDSLWTYYNVPSTLAYIVMLFVLAILVSWVARGVVRAVRDLRGARFRLPRVSLSVRATVACVLILAVTAASGAFLIRRDALAGIALPTSGIEPAPTTGPRVGAFYYTWWNNPSHDPTRRLGIWSKAAQQPSAGYYTSTNAYMVRHIRQMRTAGIDFAVVSHSLYGRYRYLMFTGYAERLGLGYAPMVETDDALNGPEHWPVNRAGDPEQGYRVSDGSRKALARLIVSAFPKRGPGRRWLRIDGRPVVFVYDGHYFRPSWDRRSKRDLAERIVSRYAAQGPDAPGRISRAWRKRVTSASDVQARYPRTLAQFGASTRVAKDFREAFVDSFREYWRELRRTVEARVGPVYLVSSYATTGDAGALVSAADQAPVFDDDFTYSMRNTWTWWRSRAEPDEIADLWTAQVESQARWDRRAGRPVFQSVTPSYDDRTARSGLGFRIPARIAREPTYDWSWRVALGTSPDFVLVATWNEFFEGSAIEPTRGSRTDYLAATRRWSARFKARP